MGSRGGSFPKRPNLGDRRDSRGWGENSRPSWAPSQAPNARRSWTDPESKKRRRSESPGSPRRGSLQDQPPPRNGPSFLASASHQTDVRITQSDARLPQDIDEQVRSALTELRRLLFLHSQLAKEKKASEAAMSELQHPANQTFPQIGEVSRTRIEDFQARIKDIDSKIYQAESRVVKAVRPFFRDGRQQVVADVDRRVHSESEDLKRTTERQVADEVKKLKAEFHTHYENKIISLEKRLDDTESKNNRLQTDLQKLRDAKKKGDEVKSPDTSAPVAQLRAELSDLRTSLTSRINNAVAKVDKVDESSSAMGLRVSNHEDWIKSNRTTARIDTVSSKQDNLDRQLSVLGNSISSISAKFSDVTEKVKQLGEADQGHESYIAKTKREGHALLERVQKLEGTSHGLAADVSKAVESLKHLDDSNKRRETSTLCEVLERVEKLESASQYLTNSVSRVMENKASMKQLNEGAVRADTGTITDFTGIYEKVEKLENTCQNLATNISAVSITLEQLSDADQQRAQKLDQLTKAHQRLDDVSDGTRAIGPTSGHDSPTGDIRSVREDIAQTEKIKTIAVATVQEKLSQVTNNVGSFLNNERQARVQVEERLEDWVKALESKVQHHTNSILIVSNAQTVMQNQFHTRWEDTKVQIDNVVHWQNNFPQQGFYDNIRAEVVNTLPNDLNTRVNYALAHVHTLENNLGNIQKWMGANRHKLPGGYDHNQGAIASPQNVHRPAGHPHSANT